MSLHAAEQDRPDLKAEREAWRAEFAAIDPSRLVFLDETGATTAMTRTRGRASRGRRLRAAVPHGHWKVVTLTAAVRLGGVGAWLAFETYAVECLAPTLKPGDIVVMDNLTAHKHGPALAAIHAAGAEVRPLPAYSPDLSPIEKMFFKLKEYLRSAEARAVGTLIDALGDALRRVTSDDIREWFRFCGYATPKAKPL